MNLKSQVESLLFISGNPFSVEKIAHLLDVKKSEAEAALKELKEEYAGSPPHQLDGASWCGGRRGVQIAAVGDKYQMITSPENSKLVQDFLKEEVIGELTRPQLEALTVIVYRGPISKVELEQIRGVNCSLILRNLLIRGLVEVKAEKDGLDKYIITHDFLKYMGITGTGELPDYEKLNADKNLADLLQRTKE